MNIPKVNISFRKLKTDVVSSSEEDGLLTFHYTICPDASAKDSFPERFQLSSSSLPYIRLRMTFPALGLIGGSLEETALGSGKGPALLSGLPGSSAFDNVGGDL